jgi:hypothetical protein
MFKKFFEDINIKTDVTLGTGILAVHTVYNILTTLSLKILIISLPIINKLGTCFHIQKFSLFTYSAQRPLLSLTI